MGKIILMFIITICFITVGIIQKKKNRINKTFFNSLWKVSFFYAAMFFSSGFFMLYKPGVQGYISAFLFHALGTLATILALIIGLIKAIVKKKIKSYKPFIITVGVIAALIGLCVIFPKPIRTVYRKAAENLKPYEHKDGLTRSLLINCFYRGKIPGYSYEVPTQIKYYSGVTETERTALVLLPASYDGAKEYPVLYILHGLNGNEYTWLKKNVDIIIQNMHYLYDCPEMIVVFPNSNVNKENSTAGMDYMEKCEAYDGTEEDLINYLMPYINANYKVKLGKENTAIAGNSMGGRNALAIAFKHQDMFDYVGVFSPAGVVKTGNDFFPPLLDEVKIDERYGGFKTLMLMVGREDYVCGYVSFDLEERLNAAGIDHIYYDVVGAHMNFVWENAMYNFCRRLFVE